MELPWATCLKMRTVPGRDRVGEATCTSREGAAAGSDSLGQLTGKANASQVDCDCTSFESHRSNVVDGGGKGQVPFSFSPVIPEAASPLGELDALLFLKSTWIYPSKDLVNSSSPPLRNRRPNTTQPCPYPATHDTDCLSSLIRELSRSHG